MGSVYIKYFMILVTGAYFFCKLLHLVLSKKQKLYFSFFILCALPVICSLRTYLAPASIPAAILLLTLFSGRLLKLPYKAAFSASVLSYAFSYALAYMAAFLLVFFPVSKIPGTPDVKEMILAALIGILQLLIAILIFRNRRLAKGSSFLLKYGSEDFTFYICYSILLAGAFFSPDNALSLAALMPMLFVAIGCLLLYFCWKNSVKKAYRAQVQRRQTKLYETLLKEQESQIKRLEEVSREQAAIIHKDNKLVPAMSHMVQEFLTSCRTEKEESGTALQSGQTADALLMQLEQITAERRGVLRNLEAETFSLPSTGVATLDSMLSYLARRAKECGISLTLQLSGNISDWVNKKAGEADFRTLLADLVENAIIAEKDCTVKNILVQIETVSETPALSVFDSGAVFTAETLLHLKTKPYTTHKSEGGSGIGIMTAFEIAAKHKASFEIKDITENNGYTKCVSVVFDSLNQYRVRTCDAAIAGRLTARPDITVYLTANL